MHQADRDYATEKLAQLKSDFLVDISKDWGDESGAWQEGYWGREELDKLHNTLTCFCDCMGGKEKFKGWTGGVTVRKADIGTHGGEALARRVSLSTKGAFSAWTVVHEFAHAWDGQYGWRVSEALEKYTGGFTSPILSFLKKAFGKHDSGISNYEKTPGRYGRLPGCNLAGYFYGDKPSGSNWSFNRKEDFAESVAMYVGWERNNDLSNHARNRIVRYQLKNGEKDPFGIVDNWQEYAEYFYPENGDYTKTKRWQFVDDLVNGRITVQ